MRWRQFVTVACFAAAAAGSAAGQNAPATAPAVATDPIKVLVDRLDLEKYKATIKGLTQFGDRRQGTDRNRAAVDWIEAQLRSYGCTNTERITYDFQPPPPRAGAPDPSDPRRNKRIPTSAQGGARLRGTVAGIGVNNDSLAQPDAALRKLDSQPSTPGQRQEVYCTKVGATHPDEMYIVG